MAKKKDRSDIPYALRIQAKKRAETALQRDDAALAAMKVATVALNDTEGMGFVRLCRFIQRFQELIKQFYSDRELEEAHLDHRMEQLGFVVKNGRMYAMQDTDGNYVKTN